MNWSEKFIQHYREIQVDTTFFKVLDIRRLSFFNGYEQTLEAIREVKINGVLELILRLEKNFTQAFKKWSHSEGHRTIILNDDNLMTRLFIHKLNLHKKK